MKRILSYLFVLLLMPYSCSVQESATTQNTSTARPDFINLTSLYNPSNTNFHPAYTIYHDSPVSSLLFIKIFPIELLYSGTVEPDKLIGMVDLGYELYEITNPLQDAVLCDSGMVSYTFERQNADKKYVTQIPLKTGLGKRYLLNIIAKDRIRNEQDEKYLYVDRISAQSEQNFLLTEPGSTTPVFKPYVLGNSAFKIKYSGNGTDSIYVYYYNKTEPLPNPAYSVSRDREYLNNPDSLWKLPLKQDNIYQLAYNGIYHIQPDTNEIDGITLFNFGEAYPRVQDVDQLIGPLTYLATEAEYNEILSATSRKLAVDNFWLNIAGEAERARDLIRVFYNRVFISNFYFTSFKPGWKTDKGMVYIIYGPPQSVKVLGDQEKWIYFKNNYTTTVTFTFNHIWSSYSTDYFILQPSGNYDSYWRSAIETWRKGRVFVIE